MKFGPHGGLGKVGTDYNEILNSLGPAGYFNRKDRRSFVMPREKESAGFDELIELEDSDIVYHGSPYKSSLRILKDSTIDIAKSMHEGEHMIHFTVLPEVAVPYSQTNGAIFPVYAGDIPKGLLPKKYSSSEIYSGDMGSGVSRVSVEINLQNGILDKVPKTVASSLMSFVDKQLGSFRC